MNFYLCRNNEGRVVLYAELPEKPDLIRVISEETRDKARDSVTEFEHRPGYGWY